jgi:hypothetical protein
MSQPEPTPLPRWRRILARVLVVLGVLILAVTILAGYLRWQAFDDETFNDTASELIANEAVRNQVAATMVDQLFANVDVEQRLQQRLPADQQGLAAPLAGAARALADQAAPRLLERPRVQALWREAVGLGHDRLVALLKGETTVVQVRDQAVVIDLRGLIVQLGERIGFLGNLSQTLPPDAGLITIMQADQLERAQDATDLFESVARWIWVVALVFFAAAIWLVPGYRRRELRAVAFGFVIAGLLILVLRAIAGRYVVDALATTTSVEEAATAAWDILTNLLADGAWTAIGLGLVALLGVWLSGPTRSGQAARRWVAPILARPGMTYGVLAVLFLLLIWWGPTDQTRRWQFLLIAAVLLVAGVEVLRRLVAREFPDAAETSPRELFRRPSWAPGRGGDDHVDELERIARLHQQGVLSDEELAAEKARLLPPANPPTQGAPG